MDNAAFARRMWARRRAKDGSNTVTIPDDAICIRFAVHVMPAPMSVAPIDVTGRVLDHLSIRLTAEDLRNRLLPIEAGESRWYRNNPGVRIFSWQETELPDSWREVFTEGRMRHLPINRYFTRSDIY